jgi:hypothetical protein
MGMRSIMFAVVISLAACAHSSGPRPINVHAVRVEIKAAIAGERAIISMGKVTRDSAEVYTEHDGRPRRREVWVKAAGAWKLQESSDVASAP